MSKALYSHIRAFRHIRHALKVDTAKSVACALLGSRLDYTLAEIVDFYIHI